MTQAVTDTNFETEVLKSSQPVLVDFWADWCGPCKQLAPVIDELAKDLGSKVKIVKMDIMESPNTPTKYNVRGIPTLILFKGGQVVDSRVGGAPKEQLQQWIESKAS